MTFTMHMARFNIIAILQCIQLTCAEVMVSGPCNVTGVCGRSPNYPDNYDNLQTCIFSGVPKMPLQVVTFDTEYSFDFVFVNGLGYSGNVGPADVIARDGIIEWQSDPHNTDKGWEICWGFAPPSTPPIPPMVPPPGQPPPSPPWAPPAPPFAPAGGPCSYHFDNACPSQCVAPETCFGVTCHFFASAGYSMQEMLQHCSCRCADPPPPAQLPLPAPTTPPSGPSQPPSPPAPGFPPAPPFTPMSRWVDSVDHLMTALHDPSAREIVLSVQGSPYLLPWPIQPNHSVTIRAHVEGRAVLDGQGKRRLLFVNTHGITLELVGLTLTGGYNKDDGGCGMVKNGSLVIRRCNVNGNYAGIGGGGALFVRGGTLYIEDSTLRGNTCVREHLPYYSVGGVIRLRYRGSAILKNCHLLDNYADWGGAVSLEDQASAWLDRCTLERNSAQNGGGFSLNGTASLRITHTQVNDNRASNYGGAFYVVGGTAHIIESNVKGNQAEDTGGAIDLEDGHVSVVATKLTENAATSSAGVFFIYKGSMSLTDSVVYNNRATYGGVARLKGGSVSISNTSVFGNNASDVAGSMFIQSGHVLMANETVLERNSLPNIVFQDGEVTYALPAPAGHWLQTSTCLVDRHACGEGSDPQEAACRKTRPACSKMLDLGDRPPTFGVEAPAAYRNITCRRRTLTQPCNWLSYPTLIGAKALSLPVGDIKDGFPYRCARGILGSRDSAEQTSVLCAGLCPAGQLCNQTATIAPVDCPKGFYCPLGSSAAIPCPEGTYGNSTRLPSIHKCDKCPPGAWCSGGSLVPCAADTYNGAPGKQSQSACQPCPTLSSTEGNQFSTSLSACKCDVQYYNGNQSGGVECLPCPVGTVCPEQGMMLLTLPIEAGYYRPSDTSTDIRRCPDAIYGCVGNGSECTSACQGGSRAPGCHPTLAGPFCLLCANRTGHYFSSATADESAQCYPCDSLGLTFTLVLSTTVAALLAIGCAFWRMRQLRYMKLALYKCRDLWFILRSRIKILVAFYQVAAKIPYVYNIPLPISVRDLVNRLELWTTLGFAAISDRLTCIGLPHGFMTQLLFWMLIPFAFMAIALIDAFVRTHRLGEHASMRELIQSAVMQATPIMLWISFLAYSVVSTTAFDAFQCYRFGLEGSEGSWLRADVSVRCGGKEHEAIERVAWVAIAIWPFGAIFAASALSFFAHLGRVYNNPELARPKLRQAISFLHIEYKPDFWWWEPLPMLLRLILVGFFVLIEPGSMTQLVLGTLTTLFFLLIQMQASPYVSMVDTYLAVSCNASLVVFFVCCIVFNIISFTELDKVQGVMTIDLETLYNTPVLALTVGMFICLLFSLFLAAFFVAWRIDESFRQRRRLCHVAGDREAVCPPIHRDRYHLFLSHCWTQGQDEMRVVKQRLHEMLPNAHVFLDVDDLAWGAGGEYVRKSEVVCAFCTRKYFESNACVRELVLATAWRKPLVALLEPDESKGGMTQKAIQDTLTDEWLSKWHFELEWDQQSPECARRPTAREVFENLFAIEPIEWNRLSSFQDVTMRLLAERTLLGGRVATTNTEEKVYLQGEHERRKVNLQPRMGGTFHLYYSEANVGAKKLVEDLYALDSSKRLCVTNELDHLPQCDHALLYLTSQTWEGARAADMKAWINEAQTQGVHLLLAHEYPSCLDVDATERHACTFSSVQGATPQALYAAGIYNEIATSLKGGKWREAGLAVLISKIAATKRARLWRMQNTPGLSELWVQAIRCCRALKGDGATSPLVRNHGGTELVSIGGSHSYSESHSSHASVSDATGHGVAVREPQPGEGSMRIDSMKIDSMRI